MNLDKWDPFTLKNPRPVSDPVTPAKAKRIPDWPEVRLLEGATAARHAQPHHYYVGSIKPGPQPCLVEVPGRSSVLILPELIIVPEGAKYSLPVEQPVYGGLLALLLHLCQNRLDAARSNEEYAALSALFREDAPFRNVHWYKMLGAVSEFLGQAHSALSLLPVDVQRSLTKVQETVKELTGCWEPYVFFVPDEMKLRGFANNRYLIEQWPLWEAAHLTPTKRLRKFLTWKKEPRPTDSRSLRTAMDTFNENLNFLRLTCSVKSGASRANSRWEIWLSEELA